MGQSRRRRRRNENSTAIAQGPSEYADRKLRTPLEEAEDAREWRELEQQRNRAEHRLEREMETDE